MLKDASDDWLKGYAAGLIDARTGVRAMGEAAIAEINTRLDGVGTEEARRRQRVEQARVEHAKFKRESLEWELRMLKGDASLAKHEVTIASVWPSDFTAFGKASAKHAMAVRKVHECEAKLAALDAEAKPMTMANAQRAVNAAASAAAEKVVFKREPGLGLVYDDEASKQANAETKPEPERESWTATVERRLAWLETVLR